MNLASLVSRWLPPSKPVRRPYELVYAGDECPPPAALGLLSLQHAAIALALIAHVLAAAKIAGLSLPQTHSIVAMTLLLVFSDLDVLTSFSAVVASINNTGPGLNQVGPSTTYEVLTDFQTWVCTAAMLLGRLEIFTLMVVLTPAFWRR